MKMFNVIVVLLFCNIAFASVPFNSNIVPEETNYLDSQHCLEIRASEDVYPTNESAYSIGDCYIRIAEELMTYFDKNDNASSPYRSRIITALQYADSWFRLAESSNEAGAESRLSYIRAYIIYFTISDQNVL